MKRMITPYNYIHKYVPWRVIKREKEVVAVVVEGVHPTVYHPINVNREAVVEEVETEDMAAAAVVEEAAEVEVAVMEVDVAVAEAAVVEIW